MRTLLTAMLVLAAAAGGVAQEAIGVRFYLVPKTVDTKGISRPKYVSTLGVEFNSMDYGLENVMLVGAVVSQAQHTTLAANTDVLAIPAPIDDPIGLTAISVVRQRLEDIHVPGTWVNETHSYREVIRLVGKVFFFNQRLQVITGKTFFEIGISLDSRINQLTVAQRQGMQQAATSLGLDTSTITGTTTVRQALQILAGQLPGFDFSGEPF